MSSNKLSLPSPLLLYRHSYSSAKVVAATAVAVQAVQLVQKARQSEDEAASQRASLQADSTDAAVAALLASRPQRRLWDDIYTISYSRLVSFPSLDLPLQILQYHSSYHCITDLPCMLRATQLILGSICSVAGHDCLHDALGYNVPAFLTYACSPV